MDLPTGKVYLVKGSSSKMWWALKNISNIEILLRPSLSLVSDICSYTLEGKNIVILPKDYSINSFSRVDSDTRVFVWLGDLEGKLINKSAEKLYKSAGGCVEQLDLTKVKIEKDPEIEGLLNSVDKDLKEELLNVLGEYPFMLLTALKSEDPSRYISLDHDYSEADIRKLFTILGTRESLEVWGSLPRSLMYRFFLTPELENCGAYSYLAGGKKKKFGIGGSLWLYYTMFVHAYGLDYFSKPQLLLKLFATWIYLSNHCYGIKKAFRFPIKTKYGEIISFEPSLRAQRLLLKLLKT
jgi:hypothetical protein